LLHIILPPLQRALPERCCHADAQRDAERFRARHRPPIFSATYQHIPLSLRENHVMLPVFPHLRCAIACFFTMPRTEATGVASVFKEVYAMLFSLALLFFTLFTLLRVHRREWRRTREQSHESTRRMSPASARRDDAAAAAMRIVQQ